MRILNELDYMLNTLPELRKLIVTQGLFHQILFELKDVQHFGANCPSSYQNVMPPIRYRHVEIWPDSQVELIPRKMTSE